MPVDRIPLPPTRPVAAHKDPALIPPPDCEDETVWLDGLRSFDATSARTLLAVMRTLCPHDTLPDAVYRRAIWWIDRRCGGDPLAAGPWLRIATSACAGIPGGFAEGDEATRVERLQALDGGDDFRIVQRTTVRHLYDDLEVWRVFGYEGAAHHLGGYAARGFDDLDWLPPVPDAMDGEG